MILAGDVGGTKTILALFEPAADTGPVREMALPSHQFPSLETAVNAFLAGGARVPLTAACFGVAGAVVDGAWRATNLPWTVDERSLARALGVRRVVLVNDLEATAHGVLALPPDALLPLQAGRASRGTMALIAAGTGLGEAMMVWDGVRHLVAPSEAGHADFAPRTEVEVDVLRALLKQFDHVSYERVLSGPGLVNIYRVLRERSTASEPEWLQERMRSGDPSAAIAEAALARRDPVCSQALEMFIGVYGAEAGNLALRVLAFAGVYVAGGIAPKIRQALLDGPFLTAFRAKGRFADRLAEIPVHLVLEPRTALLGAARVARTLPGR
jgi:glucokinase